jgi:hypothetical protein
VVIEEVERWWEVVKKGLRWWAPMVQFSVRHPSEPEPNPLEPEPMVQFKVRARGWNRTENLVLGSEKICSEPDRTEL